MNERQDNAERDRRLLAMMDELQAGAGPVTSTGEPLHDFAALLPGATPQPDPNFQQKLDARLTAAVRERTARTSEQPGGPTAQPAPTLRGNARWRKLFRPAAGATRGLVGVALVILLIAGLGALLESRRGGGFGGGQTPAPRPTATPWPTPGPDTPLNMNWTVILEPQAANDTRAEALAWAPGGRQFAAITHEGIITLWDMDAHIRQTITSTLDGGPAYVAWAPGGSLAACCYRTAPATAHIILWDPATGQQQVSLDSGADSVTALTWSPDGGVLAWSDGWSIQRWSRLSGSLLPRPAPTWPPALGTPRPATDTIRQLAWSPDGRTLATAQGTTIKVWDVTTGQERVRMDNKGTIQSLAWSPTGDVLAALPAVQTGRDQYQTQEVAFWDPATGDLLSTIALPDNATNLSWLGDTRVLAVGGDPVRLYSAITGVQLRILDRAGQVAGGPDGNTLLVAGPETVTLWGRPTAPPGPATESPAIATEPPVIEQAPAAVAGTATPAPLPKEPPAP